MSMQEELKKKLDEELKKAQEEIKKPNIMIIGATGVGKSSLINLIFGEDIAKIGIGKPVTKEITKYENKSVPVVIYDSIGYELEIDKSEKHTQNITEFILENKNSVENQIHIVWYAVSIVGHRITDFDIKALEDIRKTKTPIALILTKCDLSDVEKDIKPMKNFIHENINWLPAFALTINKINNGYLELNNLINWTINSLPEGVQAGFIKAQRVNLEEKRKKAKSIILHHATGGGLVGFVPIPFSDAPILIANEMGMVARIMNIYNLDSYIDLVKSLVGAGIGEFISSIAIWLVGQLIEFIPGVGSIIGATITASVAATITYTIGYATDEFCFRISKAAIEGNENELSNLLNKDTAGKIFESILQEKYKENKDKTN